MLYRAKVAGVRVEGTFSPLCYYNCNNALESMNMTSSGAPVLDRLASRAREQLRACSLFPPSPPSTDKRDRDRNHTPQGLQATQVTRGC